MAREPVKDNVVNPSFVRDHLANERTYLAWIRTVLAVMALGFVVARFQLIVEELTGKVLPAASDSSLSLIGIILIVIGGVMNVFALMRFKHNQQKINAGTFDDTDTAETIFTVAIVIITVILVVYLLATFQ